MESRKKLELNDGGGVCQNLVGAAKMHLQRKYIFLNSYICKEGNSQI